MDAACVGAGPSRAWTSTARRVDAIEEGAVLEMRALRLGPSAEGRIDRHHRYFRELRERARRHACRFGRAIVMLRHDLLALRRIQEAQVGLGLLARAVRIDVLVHPRDRRL